MIRGAHTGDIERFRAMLASNLGLQFEAEKSDFLGAVLERRLSQLGQTAEAYFHNLHPTIRNGEFAALARELTVGETYFFRNSEQFRALAEFVLPDLMRKNATSRTLHFLSAGCASGEEAYSLAITARERIADPSWKTVIRAVDINPAALEKAQRAHYSAWALRETPPPIADKWFHVAGRVIILDREIQAAVRFEQRNLAVEDAELWQPNSLDIVFCRNVIMYFAPEQARALIARIARALRPGGYLFLGHAETLRGVSDAFELRQSHGTFYYRNKEEALRGVPHPRSAAGEIGAADVPALSVGDAWIDAIGAASKRIAALAAAPRSPTDQSSVSLPANLAGVLDLLRSERFDEALALLRSVAPAPSRNPEMLLLEAALLVNSRQLPAAEEACRQLLAIDELHAGAAYILALCREADDDRAAAAEHDRVAAHLDAGFAMPRLHLGLLARRAGERAEGRRHLAEALVLLKREDPHRLLLFGGGFNREALLALCESALRDCGGTP